MYDLSFHKKINIRASLCLLVLLTALGLSSCGDSISNDSSMTDSLINSYMDAFCDYNIAGMNKCCMSSRDVYNDSDAVVRTCRSLADGIEWENINISIDGNSAIAQVRVLCPEDMEGICRSALNDTIKELDGGSEDDYAEKLISMIKKRVGKAKKQELSVEIHMTKVDNKWYIVKSLGVNRVLSEIRTSVAAIFSVTEN